MPDWLTTTPDPSRFAVALIVARALAIAPTSRVHKYCEPPSCRQRPDLRLSFAQFTNIVKDFHKYCEAKSL
ncbi:hypothetical protein ABQE69_15560 [Mycolicibacillus trivialis]